MTNSRTTRPRLRFTLRTLAIVVTLACCYTACWGPTKSWGVPAVSDGANNAQAIVPLIITAQHGVWVDVGDQKSVFINIHPRRRTYYFWFFGFVAKLPYEREINKQ